jgi:hypothetical protein
VMLVCSALGTVSTLYVMHVAAQRGL